MILPMETAVFLLVIGFVLLLSEMIIPGMVVGIIGTICLIAGVVLAYQRGGVTTGNYVLSGVSLAMIVGVILWVKFFPDSRLARPFISRSTSGKIGAEKPELLHHEGVAQSNLRPSGTALIDGRKIDVITAGEMIPRGAKIQVVATEGLRVVVRTI